MEVQTTYGQGYSATAATEYHTFMRRRVHPTLTRKPIIFCHGFGGHGSDAFVGVGIPNILRHLAKCGWPITFPDLAGDTWGNDTGSGRVGEAKTWMQGTGQAASGTAIIAGYSEGGLDVMNYARLNPTLVAAMVMFNPASDLSFAWTNNTLGSTSSINAAYGGTYSPSTDGPTHNPVQMAGALAGIPTLIYNSVDDPYVSPSSVSTVVGLIGASCTQRLTTGDHGDGSLSTIDPYGVSSWLNSVGV